jgi:SAM-dependent methyltransferase
MRRNHPMIGDTEGRPMRDDPAAELTDRYDREAQDYRALWAPILRKAGLVLLRELTGARVQRVLDVGTGVGALLPDLCAAFPDARVLGIDRSHGMLSLVQGRVPCAVMDARQLALPPASVDRVLMVFMLFHLERPELGLREARRVLCAGGLVGTLTWGGELESRATRIWTAGLDAHGAIPADPAASARHAAVDGPEKMEALLQSAGFTSARSWTGDLVNTIDAEHLIRLRTSMGAAKTRFDSVPALVRGALVAEARARMGRLTPEDFVSRGKVVYSVASA